MKRLICIHSNQGVDENLVCIHLDQGIERLICIHLDQGVKLKEGTDLSPQNPSIGWRD